MKSRNVLLALAGLAIALPSSARPEGGTYTFTDLGTLGGLESVAYGLNDAGQVVGWSTIPACTTANGFPCRRAFLWENGAMTDLGLLPGDEESFARAINNAGLIVGTSESDIIAGSGTFHGTVWAGGGPVALPDLGQGQSFAHDVNNSGRIAGHTQDQATNRDTAVTWQGAVITNLGTSEPHSYSRSYGISEAGLSCGFAWNLFSPNDAILWDGATWFTIGGFGQFQNAEAFDVNDNGVAVGLQAFPSGSWSATLWNQGGAVDLGTLPGLAYGELYDVNELGLAVGRCYDLDNPASRAVLYDGTQLVDLNDLLPAGTNATLYEAREINEHGDIAGTALVGGVFHAFLMSCESGPQVYCTAKTSSAGCVASISTSDLGLQPSSGASDYAVTASSIQGLMNGLLFVGINGPASVPFNGGVLCVTPPTKRGPLMNSGSGAPDTCTGSFSTLVNDGLVIPLGLDAGSGGSAWYQYWYRDPLNGPGAAGTALSDAVELSFL